MSFKNMNTNLLLLLSRIYSRNNKNNIDVQYISDIKKKRSFSETDVQSFLDENEFIKDKKLVSISPGGIRGFYMFGICKFIKENYNLDNYIFTGASAGAWNSLLLCFNQDINKLQQKILFPEIYNAKSLFDIENRIKKNILDSYTTNDFDLRRLFIGVTTFEKYKTNTTIFTGFDNLEDALDCCIASSHIPLITGGFTNIYRNILSFDGGFSKYPYLNITTSSLHITPSIWEKNKGLLKDKKMGVMAYTNLFLIKHPNYIEMINSGYTDCEKNKMYLDELFHIKK